MNIAKLAMRSFLGRRIAEDTPLQNAVVEVQAEAEIPSDQGPVTSIPPPPQTEESGHKIFVEVEKGEDGIITIAAVMTNDMIKRRSGLTGEWLRKVDEAYHAVCDVVQAEGETTLYLAFSVEKYWVALPEDIAPQEDVNRAMAEALRSEFAHESGLAGRLVAQFEDGWSRERTRLEAAWTAAREGDKRIVQLFFFDPMGCGEQRLAFMARATGRDMNFRCGVSYDDENDGYYWYGEEYGALLTPITASLLQEQNGFSGHEKLKMIAGEVPREALDEFEAYRRPNGRVKPDRPTASAAGETIFGRNG